MKQVFFVSILEVKIFGLTVSIYNDWVDWRWHQQFLELTVFMLIPKRYLKAGLSLTWGAVPLIGIMYNQSLVIPGDSRGISFQLLGASLGIRWTPETLRLYRKENKFYHS